jgi:hypothetical protein
MVLSPQKFIDTQLIEKLFARDHFPSVNLGDSQVVQYELPGDDGTSCY